MVPAAAARNYAKGLVLARNAGDDLDAIDAGLAAVADAVAQNATLRAALRSSAVPPAKRGEVARAVAGAAGAPPLVASFVALVAGNGHAALLPAISAHVRDALAEVKGIVRGEVRAAHPMSDDERRKLEAALGHAVGKRVEARVTVDPSLVGGFVARVGDHVFDASLVRQLARLRDELLRP